MTRSDDALARSGVHTSASGMLWTSRARPGLAVAGISLVEGWVQRVQGSEREVRDTMEVRGEGRGDEWHGGWHEVTA